MEIRINKFLADQGIASRRAIDKFISEKRITVNGTVIEPGFKVKENDRIAIDGKIVPIETKKYVYILLNKPPCCITTSRDTHGRKTVLDYVKIDTRVFPIGRLDKDTTGVLILTNDGDLANALMHPRQGVEKVYQAYLDRPLEDTDKKTFENGILLDDIVTAPCTTRFLGNTRRDVVVTLHEGRNRQIHRMFGSLGYVVQKLDRVRYLDLEAGSLTQGQWRYLSNKEIERLKK